MHPFFACTVPSYRELHGTGIVTTRTSSVKLFTKKNSLSMEKPLVEETVRCYLKLATYSKIVKIPRTFESKWACK